MSETGAEVPQDIAKEPSNPAENARRRMAEAFSKHGVQMDERELYRAYDQAETGLLNRFYDESGYVSGTAMGDLAEAVTAEAALRRKISQQMQQSRGVPASATEWQGTLSKARNVQDVVSEHIFGSEADRYKVGFKEAFFSHRTDPDESKPASRKMAERNAKLKDFIATVSAKFPLASK